MGKVMPLLALRAFVEAGRMGSIKAAADAMGVTAGAVSQQIRLLEARVGTALLVRTRHGVHLSDAGALVHARLLRAFEQIQQCLDELEPAQRRARLTISTVPSFAASWLVPRLGGFTAVQPQLDVRVEASNALVDLHREPVDVAIRHGLGHYPGLQVTRLMAPVLLPVASPQWLANAGPVQQPADCLRYPLLHDAGRADWRLWLQAEGVPDDPRSRQGSAFDDDLLLVRAAVAGQGIALVSDLHVEQELLEGRLVTVLQRPWPTHFAYYAVCTPAAAARAEVAAFLAWLQVQAAADN